MNDLLPQGLAFARALQDLNLGLPVLLTQGEAPLAFLYPLERASAPAGVQIAALLEHGILKGVRFMARASTAQGEHILTADADSLTQLQAWQSNIFDHAPTHIETTPSALLINARDILRRAELLPAGWLLHIAGNVPFAAQLSRIDMALFSANADPRDALTSVELLAQARLPVEGSAHNTLYAFRNNADGIDHYALHIGSDKPVTDDILVRMHSECFTGDFLGSLKCDCGPQLKAAIARMVAAGQGVLLYLRQEGRGIGLSNKVRAYALQDAGMDTVDANLHLGFGVEQRHFKVAVQMLQTIGINSITLLTNNPRKTESAEQYGLRVVARAPLIEGVNPFNADYLATKRDRTGHHLNLK